MGKNTTREIVSVPLKTGDVRFLDKQARFKHRDEYLEYLIKEYIYFKDFDTYTVSSLYNYAIKTKRDASKSINIDKKAKDMLTNTIQSIKGKYGVKLTYASLIHYALELDLSKNG